MPETQDQSKKDLLLLALGVSWEYAMGLISNRYASQISLLYFSMLLALPILLTLIWIIRMERQEGRIKSLLARHPISSAAVLLLFIFVGWSTFIIFSAKLHHSLNPSNDTAKAVSSEKSSTPPAQRNVQNENQNGTEKASPIPVPPTRPPIAPTSLMPPKSGVEGSDNTVVNDQREIRGNGNTIVGATDANGNTILNKGGAAIGRDAHASPTGTAIGAGAGGGQLSPTIINADHGAVNTGTNFGVIKSEDNRRYGAAKPAPAIVGLIVEPVAPVVFQYPDGMGARMGKVTGQDHPGLSLTFHLSNEFSKPVFIVHCDRPCIADEVSVDSYMEARRGSTSLKTADPQVVGFNTGFIDPVYANSVVKLVVRSLDSEPLNAATVEGYVH